MFFGRTSLTISKSGIWLKSTDVMTLKTKLKKIWVENRKRKE